MKSIYFFVACAVTITLLYLGCKKEEKDENQKAIEALTSTNPCDVEKFGEPVYYKLGQVSEYHKRTSECAKNRRKKTKELRTKHCQNIIDGIRNGKLADNDKKWLGKNAGLIVRIIEGSLESNDLKRTKANLPCGERLIDIFVSAAAKSKIAWGGLKKAEDVSEDLQRWLGEKPKPALSTEAAQALQTLVKNKAKTDLKTAKHSAEFEPLISLCDLKKSLLGTSCALCEKVTDRFNTLTATESFKESKENAARARREAKEARKVAARSRREAKEDAARSRREIRCESIQERVDQCVLHCMDRFEPTDRRGYVCMDRCKAALTAAGCNDDE